MDTVRGVDTWHTVFRIKRRHSVLPRERQVRSVVRHAHALIASLLAGHRRGVVRAEAALRDLPRQARVHREQQGARRRASSTRSTMARSSTSSARCRFASAWTRRFNDYFKAERNPIRFKVLRKDTIDVPAGRFPAIVVQPIFQSKPVHRGRTRRGLAFRRRQPHHAADEVEACASVPSASTSNRTARPRRPTATGRKQAADRHGDRAARLTREADLSAIRTDPRRAPTEQGQAPTSSRIRRATIGRSPHSSRRSPTCSSRATSAPSSTRSPTPRVARRGVVAMLGGHVVKTGLAPLLIELMRRGVITHLAMNGSAAIHDYEMARFGATSEDVAAGLRDGTFGMADETGREMNDAFVDGMRARQGMGESLGRALDARSDLAHPELSLLLDAHASSASPRRSTRRSAPRSFTSIRRRTARRSATRAIAIFAASPRRSPTSTTAASCSTSAAR